MPTLKIENFQSLKHVELDIKPLTVIVGASDCGKSALVRSLEACLFNSPGSDYITHGESKCLVSFEGIEFTKGNSSAYKISNRFYNAIGRGPFEEVVKLGYSELDVDQIAIRPQLSKQYDLPFLISSIYTPIVISQLLGTLSDSSILSKAKKSVEKDLKELESGIRAKEDQIRSFDERQVDLSMTINSLRPDIEAVKKEYLQVFEISSKLEKLSQLKENFFNLRYEFSKLSNKLSFSSNQFLMAQPHYNVSGATLDVFKERQSKLANFYGIKADIESLRKREGLLRQAMADNIALRSAEQANSALAKIKPYVGLIHALSSTVDVLRAIAAKVREVLATASRFFGEFEIILKRQSMIVQTLQIQTDIGKLIKSKNEIMNTINELNKQLSEYEYCPLCGSSI